MAIPSSARKVVEELKQIVKNSSEDEIYAALLDCNMDPDDTAQRLLNQDTFHEVRRKRDKKRENGNKDMGDVRSRRSGLFPSGRGGRVLSRGTGRGNYAPYANNTSEFGGGRAPTVARENGSYQNSRALGNSIAPSHVDAYVQPKSMPSETRESLSGISSSIIETSNGSIPPRQSVVQEHRSLWGAPGRMTMAEIVKSKACLPRSSLAANTHIQHSVLVSSDNSSVVDLPASVSLLNERTDANSLGLIKRDSVENRNGVENQIQSLPDEGKTNTSLPLQSQASDLITEACLEGVEGVVEDSSTQIKSANDDGDSPGCMSSGIIESLEARQTLADTYQFNTREVYEIQQQTAVFQKDQTSAGPSVDTVSTIEEDIRLSAPESSLTCSSLVSEATSKLQQLHVRNEEQRVIIPQYLQVPEAERINLRFGTFDEHFDSVASPAFVFDDNSNKHSSLDEVSLSGDDFTVEEVVEQTADSSATRETPVPTSSPEAASSLSASSVPEQEETSKSDPIIEQNPQYPYLPDGPSCEGFGVMPQVAGNQQSYEPEKIQPSQPWLPNFAQPHLNPASFHDPVIRASSDDDACNPHILSTNTSSKYSTGISLMTAQSVSTPQTGGNTGQAIQTSGGSAQTTIAMPQHPLAPMQAYPAPPASFAFSPFATNFYGYQLLPPNLAFVHAPYPAGYTGNTGYPQVPTGNSFAPATGKYSLSQHKPPSASSTNAPHAGGYGNYSTSPSGFAVGASVAASSYEDVVGSQLKENNIYIANQQQQVEGSTLWPSRDMAGMQGNSYYNMAAQGQHSGYGHSHPLNGHLYANLYHPSQSHPPTHSAPHLLQQQSQGLGASQAGNYQQALRSQLNWANGY